MTNRSRSHVLYTGVTGNLSRRIFEHKNKPVPGFTARYNLTRLVYYELFYYPRAAIEREKQIKGWTRNRKIALITQFNPKWDDLAANWYNRFKPDSDGTQSRSVLHARSFGAEAPQDDADDASRC